MSAKLWMQVLSIIALIMALVSNWGTISATQSLDFTESSLLLATIILTIISFKKK